MTSLLGVKQVPVRLGQGRERRSADRFPIEREVRYRIMSKKSGEIGGAGKTVNISSNGILFTTQQYLIPGRRVELSVSWPATLDNKTALKLVARGKVVRYVDGSAAMEIQQYEFRTTVGSLEPPPTA